jgi:hypothetical protein
MRKLILSACLFLFTFTLTAAPRVINGSDASSGQYPFMASLHYADSTPYYSHFCGGALIAPNKVITAAHCALDFIGYESRLRVALNLTKFSTDVGEVHEVKSILVHNDYDGWTSENDIAIIELKDSSSVTPIQLISESDTALWDDNSPAFVIGWGVKDPLYSILANTLQVGSVNIHSDEVCVEDLGTYFIPSSSICAGVLSSGLDTYDGVDTCNGDSGGPLFVDDSGTLKLVGLTSWGFDCSTNHYGVYTKIPAFLDWVNTPPPVAINQPKITLNTDNDGEPISSATVDSTLKCHGAEFSGSIDNYTYVWYATDYYTTEEISRETLPLPIGSVYTVTDNELGKFIYCTAIAANSSGTATYSSTNTVEITESVEQDTRAPKLRISKPSCINNNCSAYFIASDNLEYVDVLAAITYKKKCTASKCRPYSKSIIAYADQYADKKYRVKFKKRGAGTLNVVGRATDSSGNSTTKGRKFNLKK